MKKLLAIVIAMMMVMTLSVSVFAAGTASTEFQGTCADDAWWSRLIYPVGAWEPASEGWLDTEVVTFDNWHYNITKLVEKAAGTDLSNVTYVKATLEMVDSDSITKYNSAGSSPKVDLETGTVYNADATARFGDGAPYQETDLAVVSACTIDGNKAIVEGAIPEGSKVVALNIGGFGTMSIPENFKLTVEVTVKGEAAPEPEAPADEPETTEPEAPADEPEAPAAEPTAPSTGLALAVVPAVVAMAAAVISKKH